MITSYWYEHHPLNVVGSDGYEYPWIFNIDDFKPINGRIHQPPPVHQTFQGRNFSCARLCLASLIIIRCRFQCLTTIVISIAMRCYIMSTAISARRRGIEQASITLHPRGIPHGPQPGTVEKSLGAERTEELEVMSILSAL